MTIWVLVDWELDLDDLFDGEYDDISADVMSWNISRGRDDELQTIPAATLEVRLRNPDDKYTPCNKDSLIHDYLLPYRPIIVVCGVGEEPYILYYGYISSYTPHPDLNAQDIYIYAVDSIDLLARDMIVKCDKIKEGGGCLIKGTLILTPTGLEKIEDIKAGDKVIGYKNGEGVETNIEAKSIHWGVWEIYQYKGSWFTGNHRVYPSLGEQATEVAFLTTEKKVYVGNVYDIRTGTENYFGINNLLIHNKPLRIK